MTSTSETSLISEMLDSTDGTTLGLGHSLRQAVRKYSLKEEDGKLVEEEVTTDLRVLGAPIGSTRYGNELLEKTMSNDEKDTSKLLTGLEDFQTAMGLFSQCTVHKITHLFSSDVLNTPHDKLPNCLLLLPPQWKHLSTTNSFHDQLLPLQFAG